MIQILITNFAVKTPGSQSHGSKGDASSEDNDATASVSLISDQKAIPSTSKEYLSSPVRASSLRPYRSSDDGASGSAEHFPLASMSILDNVAEKVGELGSKVADPEALSLLKSIETEVKSQGKILTAFVDSTHEFRRQMTNEISGIKELLETNKAR